MGCCPSSTVYRPVDLEPRSHHGVRRVVVRPKTKRKALIRDVHVKKAVVVPNKLDVIVAPIVPRAIPKWSQPDFAYGNRDESPFYDALVNGPEWIHVHDRAFVWCQLRRTILWESFAIKCMIQPRIDPMFKKMTDKVYVEKQTDKRVEWDNMVKKSRANPRMNPMADDGDPRMSIQHTGGPRFVPQWVVERFEMAIGECKSPVPMMNGSHIVAYTDIFYRDTDIPARMAGAYQNVTVVVALLSNTIYMGHVYLWTEHDQPDRVYMMGIRATVWGQTITCSDATHTKRHVAHSLLEGVRQRTLQMGRKQISVVRPIGAMPQLLTKLGFVPEYNEYDPEKKHPAEYFHHPSDSLAPFAIRSYTVADLTDPAKQAVESVVNMFS